MRGQHEDIRVRVEAGKLVGRQPPVEAHTVLKAGTSHARLKSPRIAGIALLVADDLKANRRLVQALKRFDEGVQAFQRRDVRDCQEFQGGA